MHDVGIDANHDCWLIENEEAGPLQDSIDVVA